MTRHAHGSAAAEHTPIDKVVLSLGVALDLIHAPTYEAVADISRFWSEGLGHAARVEVSDEHVVRLADGRARIVAEVTIAGARVVATLLGAVAEPGEWAVRLAGQWPS